MFDKFALPGIYFLILGQRVGNQKDAQEYKDKFICNKMFSGIKSLGDILEELFPKVVLEGKAFLTIGQRVQEQKDAREYKDKPFGRYLA